MTTRRYFKVAPAVYTQMAAGVDQSRNYPLGAGTPAVTLRGLADLDTLPVANDGSGFVLVNLESWRFEPSDDAMMQPAIDAGYITELDAESYAELLPIADQLSPAS